MNTPANLKYTKSDEWFDPATGKMGLTDYAQGQLSDIVFVELLVEAGDSVEVGKAIASVESVKASAEIFASASGKVAEVNKGHGRSRVRCVLRESRSLVYASARLLVC
jgi:glycine cleavage system H protein